MIVDLVLYAEFDIDKGSTLRASFPAQPNELEAAVHRTPEFFADMMLPEGVHNREQDYTVFFIHEDNHVKYCLSVVKTMHDANVRRGARIKAVSICSNYHFCFAFKDVLSIAIDKLFALGSNETPSTATNVLLTLFNVINAVNVSGVTSLQASEVEVRLLKRSMCARPLGGQAHTSDESLVVNTQAQWDYHIIPLQIKLGNTHDQHEEGSLIDLIAKFGDQTMQIYNAVLAGSRIIMLGYGLPAGKMCNYVLSTSALLCPPLVEIVHRQFPYANLTDLAFISVPGFIAGVTNPMFKGRKEWWDMHCDLASGELLVSQPPEKDDADAADRDFILEVMDGIEAGFSESWVRCMFEEYTRQNIVDIAMGEAHFIDRDAQGRRTAINNKRITRWARTENYERFLKARETASATSSAFDVKARGVDLKRHLGVLMHENVEDETQVERIYADLVTLINDEDELKEMLSYIPRSKGGLHVIAQGLFHHSISVKYNTMVLLKRLESFTSTKDAVESLNPFIAATYSRLHATVVQPKA
ncbi:hypothetical protein AeNC1_000309 [Aphanomyces euteiches]|nr:hypothetical protein AeNC1_000309 [Aphanomyces euteiches]